MKKTIISLITVIAISGLIFSGCKKEEPEPDVPGTLATPVVPPSFTWTTSSGSTGVADSTYYYSSFTTIFAFKGGSANSFEINLSSLSAATYTISSATGNALTFDSFGTTYTATSGTLAITTVSNNRLSGNFSAALSGGTLTSVSGQFKEIPGKN